MMQGVLFFCVYISEGKNEQKKSRENAKYK